VFCRFDLSVRAVFGLRAVGMLGLEREGIFSKGDGVLCALYRA